MAQKINYVRGQKIRDCVYLYDSGRTKAKKRIATFICICGNEFDAIISEIKSGHTLSCGCFRKTNPSRVKHRLINHPLYKTWSSIKARCYNNKRECYDDYGGRGIIVCDEWKNDFKAFYDHVMSLPNAMEPGLTIDRKKNDGNYEPGNIRWATRQTQSRNQRRNHDKYATEIDHLI